MVEYTFVSHMLFIVGGTTMLFLSTKLFNALTIFFRAIYMVLETGSL